MPSAARERRLLEGVVRALAGDADVIEVSALAGEAREPQAIAAALRERARDGSVVVCADVLERMTNFGDLVSTLTTLATQRDVTVLLAVTNEPYADGGSEARGSVWGAGAIEELRQLLPAEHLLWHEVALRGAALVPADGPAALGAEIEIDHAQTVPVGFVIAFGPRAANLAATATVGAADLSAERAYERARTAELEVLRARVGARPARPELGAPNVAHAVENAG